MSAGLGEGATYGPMVGAIDLLLRACEASAKIRRGVDAEDLLLLMGFLGESHLAAPAKLAPNDCSISSSTACRLRTDESGAAKPTAGRLDSVRIKIEH